MTSDQTSVGIDHRSGHYYLARVRHEASGHEVISLDTIAESDMQKDLVRAGEPVILAVPDNQVVVKNLRIHDEGRWEARHLAQFELSMSLLDDENEFCFAILPTRDANHCLGLMTRRRNLARIGNSLFPSGVGVADVSPKYEMQAVALGKGYINFCHPKGGDLVCLVDFGNDAASICIVLKHKIIDVACLSMDGFYPDQEQGLNKMAIEIRTVVSFRLASLFHSSAPPLSALHISGNVRDSSIGNVLEQHFQITVTTPKVNEQLLAASSVGVRSGLEKYLVAMGLAVI